MKRLKLFLCAAALITFTVTSTTFAQTDLTPGTVNYSIEQNGKKLGSASYTIESQPNKFLVTSTGKMSDGKFTYAFSNTQKVDRSLNLITDQLSGVVNGKAVSFSASSDPTGRQFKLDISADGTRQNNAVDRNQNAVLLTDLDPAAYLLLARVAMRTPSHSWALIPKENGFLVPVTFTPQPDTQGHLNGQAIPVKYTSAAIGGQNAITIQLFYSPDGQLLEADLPQQNFYVIREGFKLTNRPKPPELPREAAPPAPDQNQQSKLQDSYTGQ